VSGLGRGGGIISKNAVGSATEITDSSDRIKHIDETLYVTGVSTMSADEIYQKIQNKISVEILEITGGAKMSDSQVEVIVRKYSAFAPRTVLIEVFLSIKKAMSHTFFLLLLGKYKRISEPYRSITVH